MPSGEIGWARRVMCGRTGLTVEPHITKVDWEFEKGAKNRYYTYFLASRMGIEFQYEELEDESPTFVANLELGDIARLIKVLTMMEGDSAFRSVASGTVRSFQIPLTFSSEMERGLEIGADSGNDCVLLSYFGVHQGQEVSWEHSIPRENLEELCSALKEQIVEYTSLILKYALVGKIDKRFS